MSDFRFEKHQVTASLVLSTGAIRHGCFFVVTSVTHDGLAIVIEGSEGVQSIERLRGEDVRVTPTRVSADLQHGADYRSPLADLESGGWTE